MGITDRGGHAKGGDETVKFKRCDKAAFDVQMRVDETGHEGEAGNIHDLFAVVIGAGANDGIATNRHITV